MRVRIVLFGSLSVLQINAAFENMNEVSQLMYESKNCVLQINAAFENMNEVEVNGSVN